MPRALCDIVSRQHGSRSQLPICHAPFQILQFSLQLPPTGVLLRYIMLALRRFELLRFGECT